MNTPPNAPNAPHLPKRMEAIASNARHWLRVDFEMINTALEVELNCEMNPMRSCKVAASRLQQMSKKDRAAIPLVIWGLLDALDVTSTAQFHRFNPTAPAAGQENRSGWFTVTKQPPSTICIVPRKTTPERFLAAMRGKERYRVWHRLHRPEVRTGPDCILMTAPILADMPEKMVETILTSF